MPVLMKVPKSPNRLLLTKVPLFSKYPPLEPYTGIGSRAENTDFLFAYKCAVINKLSRFMHFERSALSFVNGHRLVEGYGIARRNFNVARNCDSRRAPVRQRRGQLGIGGSLSCMARASAALIPAALISAAGSLRGATRDIAAV